VQLLSYQGHPFPFVKDEELCGKLISLDVLDTDRYLSSI
jgi:hypothetical protein